VVGPEPAVLDASGITRLRRDKVHSFKGTDLWFQRRGGQKVGLSKLIHIISHKEKSLYPFGVLF
jgi:hypothetical protein